jgi:hypothetical protein
VRVEHDSLGVLGIARKLESAAVETGAFAELADFLSVKVGVPVELKDTFCNLRGRGQVNFEEAGLEVAFVGQVAFEGGK